MVREGLWEGLLFLTSSWNISCRAFGYSLDQVEEIPIVPSSQGALNMNGYWISRVVFHHLQLLSCGFLL